MTVCKEMVEERGKAGRVSYRGSECLVMEMQSECGGGEGQNLCEALGSLGYIYYLGQFQLMYGVKCRQLDGIEQIL